MKEGKKMYCFFCNQENDDKAVFCAYCGQQIQMNTVKRIGFLGDGYRRKNRTRIILLIAAIVCLSAAIIGFVHMLSSNKTEKNSRSGKVSIVGSWENSEGRTVSFDKDGNFLFPPREYGYYVVYEDKTLHLEYRDAYDFLDTRNLKYGKEAKEGSYDYWYIENGILYILGENYKKSRG